MRNSAHLLFFSAFATLFACPAAFSAVVPTVVVTSFLMAGPQTNAAAICGQVYGALPSALTVVQINVDPNTVRPSTYQVLAGPDGRFCSAIVTWYGAATASVWTPGGLTPPVPAHAVLPN